MCPITEDVCEHVINLPTHKGIGEEEASEIVEFIAHSSWLIGHKQSAKSY